MITQPQHIIFGSYSDSQSRPSLYDLVSKDQGVYKVNQDFVNPSFVVTANNLIYLVEETENGRLVTLDHQFQTKSILPTQGNDPCHICINHRGDRLVVTNYSSGSFAVYELKDGIPTKMIHFVMHDGSGPNPQRQQSAHPHSSIFSQCDNILFIADLGTDVVYYYEISQHQIEGLKFIKEKSLKMPGCGPRHLAHDPNDKILYLTGELDSTLRVLSYQGKKIELLGAYRVSQNPSNFLSEVKVFDGAIMTVARGDNYLIVFDQKENHELAERFRFKVGQWPRHFNISQSGTIYVACQLDNIIQRYRFENGKVMQVGTLKISSPSCIAFIK